MTFKNNIVTSVYGGHTDSLYGDILVLTTHQLYRYNKYFDLLILDEIDAFPYKGNDVLYNLFLRSLKGNYVLMSATPDDKTLKLFKNNGYDIVKLFKRYHSKPIPIPKIIKKHMFFKLFYIIKKLKEYKLKHKQCFVFCPTIDITEDLFLKINLFLKDGNYVHSKRNNRDLIIDEFRNKKYSFLITTAVLERGVTVKGLQVIIFDADNKIYSKDALIQISGRVGRVIGEETGEVIFLCDKETKEMNDAIEFTKRANKSL